MTLNDGGDPSSEGDFFSQFGKATTTSGEGCMRYVCEILKLLDVFLFSTGGGFFF